MGEQTIRVLLVEDNPDDSELTCLALSKAVWSRFDVLQAGRLNEAIELLRREAPDVLLLDLGLPDSEGFGGLAAIRQENDEIPIIVLTGNTDEEAALQALDRGAQDYLSKAAVSADTLSRAIRYAIQRQQLVGQITRAKRLLEKKNRRLAKLYKTAHQFVDNVSHEFRTPLTVIKEYAALLREGVVGQVDDEQGKLLDVIGDRADDLNTMVDDMLDVSKLESGLLGVARRNHRTSEIIGHVLPALQRKASVRGVTLNVQCAQDLPEVYCDAEKVGRIIINLTVNAIKFCRDPGLVQLWARRETRDAGVVIGITDNGPGIDPENLAAIFRRFRQLRTDGRSSTKGFGLGLNIAKELVDLNFGNMTVESELGQGSTFSFTLPPADPAQVMQLYMHRVEHLRNGGTDVTLIRGEICESVDSDAADDVDALLGCLLRRNDLLFRARAHHWLLVLNLDDIELDKFLTRAEKLFQEANRNRPFGPLPDVHLRSEGTWQLSRGRRELMEHFMMALEGALETAHV